MGEMVSYAPGIRHRSHDPFHSATYGATSGGGGRAAPVGVLHVVDCLNVGGTERQLFELLRRIDRQRYRPLVACFKQGGELFPRLVEIGLPPIEFPLRGSLAQANTGYQIARMALLCRRENIKIIHAHDFYSNLIGVAAAGLAGAKCIASRRDLAHWLSPTQRKALRFACRMADVVLANAAAVAFQTVSELGVSASSLLVIPNGIDVAHFDLQACKLPDPLLPAAPASLPRIVMVGSMHLPDKGHGDLLEAAAILKTRGIRAQWILVSDGVCRPALEQQSRTLGLTDDVIFIGRRDDVPSILSRADLIVHPSWSEGFPNAVLEGMCAARPIVATRVGGIPEVMQNGVHGYIVEPKQPVELAGAIEKALANPLAGHVMGLRGRQHVEEKYSLDKLCRTVVSLYDSLLGIGDRPFADNADHAAPAASAHG